MTLVTTSTPPTDGRFRLDDKYLREEGTIYLSGLQALVRLLLDQHRADQRRGLRTAAIVSGYPGSPLGGLDIEISRQRQLLQQHDIVSVPGLNEDLAATAVFGGQLMDQLPGAKYDGVVGMWFGKAPGVDRSGDAFRHANFRGMGRNGGVIAVAGDDPNAKSSILPSDSTPTFYDLMMPMLYPADVQDVIDFGLHAFMLSRTAHLGVGFKIVADVADSAGTAIVGADRIRPVIPEIDIDGVRFEPRMQPNLAGRRNLDNERRLIHGRLALAQAYARENGINRVIGRRGRAKVGIIACGKTYLDLVEALALLGIHLEGTDAAPIRILKLAQVFPVDPREFRDFADGLDEVIVIEEKRAFVELFVKEALFQLAQRPIVVGKVDEKEVPLVPDYGQLTPESVAAVLASRLESALGRSGLREAAQRLNRVSDGRPTLPIARTNYFCSGCPHSTGLQVPEGSIVGGGIGCHTMALSMEKPEFGSIIGFTQMGAEGAQWVGVSPFVEASHFFQNIGDGTLFHSGTLAIRFAVAANANITYKILFNGAVAMTGGQPVIGGKTVPDLIRMLDAEGVKRVIVTTDDMGKYRGVRLPAIATVHPRERLLESERELSGEKGVTVLIHDQECAAEKRRLRKRGKMEDPNRHVFINERVCEGCGDCGQKSNCLSVIPVETDFGRKTAIHQSSCNKDYTCLNGDCPSFVTVKRTGPAVPIRRPMIVAPAEELADPEPLVPRDNFTIYMTGIGGTGVVTVDQVLGTAGVIAGRSVRTLDLFGGSQKAGPVASHLRISTTSGEHAYTIPNGAADALLVFDILVGTEAAHIAKANSARTVAVVSTTKVPTGKMVTDPTLDFPKMPIFMRVIEANTRAKSNVYLDAQLIAERLLGDHMATNMLLVGAAYQRGVLPLPIESIEEAIKLNGTAVQMNLNAFRWGRLVVANPKLVEEAMAAAALPAKRPVAELEDTRVKHAVAWASGELRRLLETRTADLVSYQGHNYANRYMDFVKGVARAEAAVVPDATELTEAVARNLYKLMAYKDEYEVARLHLDEAARAAVTQEFGAAVKIYWHIHPPIFRAMGLNRKLVLGAWFKPAFQVLRAMRGVRGTRWDLFGYAKMRRLERQLIDEYRSTIQDVLPQLTLGNRALMVELASLPDMVRGYEEVKLRNVGRYEARRRELAETLVSPDAPLAEELKAPV